MHDKNILRPGRRHPTRRICWRTRGEPPSPLNNLLITCRRLPILFTVSCEQTCEFRVPLRAARKVHMKLSEIRTALREIRLSPAKTLGQNFLHDQNLARWIVDQAQITPDDYVVEIGPGLGALTRFILEKGAHVLAIEKDTRLADFLRAHLDHERLEILNIDALKFDRRSLFAHRTVKLVGNLPYNISSALLLKLL